MIILNMIYSLSLIKLKVLEKNQMINNKHKNKNRIHLKGYNYTDKLFLPLQPNQKILKR
jgi:hypothetical protein